MMQATGSRRRRSAKRRRGAGRAVLLRQWREHFPLVAVALTTLGMTLVGGAPLTSLGVLVLVASAVLLLAATASSPEAARLADLPWQSQAALASIIVLPVLQVIPLPSAVWHALPGQEIRRVILATIGQADSWQPVSLTPLVTLEAAIACLTLVALVATMLLLNDGQLRKIGWLLLAIVSIDIAIGTLQVASGGYPILRESRNQGVMLGLFANKNHMALFVAAAMPLAWWVLDVRRHRDTKSYLFFGWCLLALVALAATNSRSGLVAGVVAAVTLGLQLLPRRSVRVRGAALLGAVLAVAIVSFTNPFGSLFRRFTEVDDDLRWNFWVQSMPLLKTYWPLGAGASSFTQLFIVNEQLAWVKPTYVNAAHNDYLQLVIEFGLPGVAVAALFLTALVRSGTMTRGSSAGSGTMKAIRAGSIIIILFALQSVVDYPLRRVATLPMFAMATVLILRAALERASARRTASAAQPDGRVEETSGRRA